MTRELQSTLEVAVTWWPAMRNHIPCMAHIIQLALGAFMTNLRVRCRTKSWEARERDQQFGEHERTESGKSQRLWKEGNVRINKVSAVQPGLAKINEKICISRHFERPETDLHIAENACWIYYADTWSSKQVHWLSHSQSTNCSTTYDGCENTVEFHTGVGWASIPSMKIPPRVAQESRIQRLTATLHSSGWMDHSQVRHGSFKAIRILDPVDIENGYCYSALHYHCLQWHVRSRGLHYTSFASEEDTMEVRLILRCEGCTPEAVQILCRIPSNDWSAAHFGTYPSSFTEVTIIQEVGPGDGY